MGKGYLSYLWEKKIVFSDQNVDAGLLSNN
jgi:hypothetical protein